MFDERISNMNKNRKKVKEYQELEIEFYYNMIFQHGVFAVDEKGYILRLGILLVYAIGFMGVASNTMFFHNQAVASFLRKNTFFDNIGVAYIILYFSLVFLLLFFYHTISICYERKNKYKLEINKQSGIYKIVYCVMNMINTPWIMLTISFFKILKKIKLYNIRKLLLSISLVYCYEIVIGCLLYSGFIKLLIALNERKCIINSYFNEMTWLSLGGVIVYILLGKISELTFKIFTCFSIFEDKKIKEEYHRLNKYMIIIASIILKLLYFEGSEKTFVDVFWVVLFVASSIEQIKEKMK